MRHNVCNAVNYPLKSFSKNMNSIGDSTKFVWIDMEMTGLDLKKDKVLEVACIITDPHLRDKIGGPHLVIHQPDDILNSMNEWCTNQHTKSGLIKASKESKITELDAERILLEFISQHVGFKNGIVAGNSVYVDKMFLAEHFPKINEYLHYRIVDVSSIKEICRSWYPQEFCNAPKKILSHRALDDIMESIEELRYYGSCIFKQK